MTWLEIVWFAGMGCVDCLVALAHYATAWEERYQNVLIRRVSDGDVLSTDCTSSFIWLRWPCRVYRKATYNCHWHSHTDSANCWLASGSSVYVDVIHVDGKDISIVCINYTYICMAQFNYTYINISYAMYIYIDVIYDDGNIFILCVLITHTLAWPVCLLAC